MNSVIHILIMGNPQWVASFNKNRLSTFEYPYTIEIITDIDKAIFRLEHNSYDLLILEDEYFKNQTINLVSMAYAMTRPSLIICSNIIKLFSKNLMKIFSSFFRKYKTSKKLIYFTLDNNRLNSKIEYLAKNHLQYTNIVKLEVSKTTGI